MKKYAAVFPGQGSQSVGMFADFMDSKVVAQTYQEANDALGYDLRSVTLNGPESELNKTEVTQPAILTASVAAYRALLERAEAPAAVAGHSLGEYSALVAAGVMNFTDAVKLVRLRGQAMQEAVPEGVGAMAAILGLDDQVVIDVCDEVSSDSDKVWAANFNTPGQVVISGNKAAVDKAAEAFTAKGARRVVPLAVSAPSHCPLMQSAADRLAEALEGISFNDAKVAVYCNYSAEAITSAADIKTALIKQLTCPVRWVKSVENMKAAGIEAMLECGPNKVLCGLIRKIDKNLVSSNICNEDTLSKALTVIA